MFIDSSLVCDLMAPMKQSIDIIISRDGQIRFIYKDDLLGLSGLGETTIQRASHVEPCGGGWSADMSPVDGPILGPYKTRAEALHHEVEWLMEHNIPQPKVA